VVGDKIKTGGFWVFNDIAVSKFERFMCQCLFRKPKGWLNRKRQQKNLVKSHQFTVPMIPVKWVKKKKDKKKQPEVGGTGRAKPWGREKGERKKTVVKTKTKHVLSPQNFGKKIQEP